MEECVQYLVIQWELKSLKDVREHVFLMIPKVENDVQKLGRKGKVDTKTKCSGRKGPRSEESKCVQKTQRRFHNRLLC